MIPVLRARWPGQVATEVGNRERVLGASPDVMAFAGLSVAERHRPGSQEARPECGSPGYLAVVIAMFGIFG